MTTRTEQETRRETSARSPLPTTGPRPGRRGPGAPHPVPPPATEPASGAQGPGTRPAQGPGTRPAQGPGTGTGPGSRPVPPPRPAADRAAPTRTRPNAPSGTPEGAPARAARPTLQRRPARRRQRAPFVLLVVGLLCGGLVSLLLLNTVLARDSITAADLREEIATARLQNEYLKQRNQVSTQPGAVASEAEQQGMRRDPGVNPLFPDEPARASGEASADTGSVDRTR